MSKNNVKNDEKRRLLLERGQKLARLRRDREAEKAFREAAALKPDNAEALFHLGHFLQERGRAPEAIPIFRRARKKAPDAVEILLQLALAQQDAGDLKAAEASLRQATTHPAQSIDAHALLGNLLAQQGRYDTALESYRRALSLKPGEGWILLNLAHTLSALGLIEEAGKHYQAATATKTVRGVAFQGLGRLAQSQGQFERALDYYRKALDENLNDPSAHHAIATAFRDLGRIEDARAHFEKADALHPNPASRAALASLLERAHMLDEAAEAAKAALALAPNNAEALLVQAKIAKRQGAASKADKLYLTLIGDIESGRVTGGSAILARSKADLAALREAGGDYESGLQLYREANEANCRSFASWKTESDRYLARVRDLHLAVRNLPDLRSSSITTPEAAPIFLVGFPRSGTTLVDQLLNAHSRLEVMEEKTILDRVSHAMGGREAERPGRAFALSDEEAAKLRKLYEEESAAYREKCSQKSILVDKLPLNILNLWLAAALYPGAKVLLVLRDPRDVCWSCYSNLFRLGPGIAGFADLDSTAALYAQVMSLWLDSVERLPLSFHTLRYEDLIVNLEQEGKALFKQLDLEWEESVLDYRKSASERYIVTPSYHQVVQPLYKSAKGRWKHYEKAMEPINETLKPFLQAFGYC